MTRRTLDETLAFVTRVEQAKAAADVASIVINEAAQYGCTNVLAGTIPFPGMTPEQQIANVIMQDWPEEWSQRYFTQNYLFEDPTIDRVNSSTEPFLWSELEPIYRDDNRAMRVMNEASDFKLGHGLTIPMVTLDGLKAGFSLAGERVELPPLARKKLQLTSTFALVRALTLNDDRERTRLTIRELDVLHWLAEGKGDWEISVILNVSEHLVDKMARNIKRKLNAANRTHAVALALRQKLIT